MRNVALGLIGICVALVLVILACALLAGAFVAAGQVWNVVSG